MDGNRQNAESERYVDRAGIRSSGMADETDGRATKQPFKIQIDRFFGEGGHFLFIAPDNKKGNTKRH